MQEVARRMPGALLVVLVGILIAVIQYPSVLRTLRFGPSMPQLVWPTWEERCSPHSIFPGRLKLPFIDTPSG